MSGTAPEISKPAPVRRGGLFRALLAFSRSVCRPSLPMVKLPPRLWALFRSRRTKYLVACSPFIFVALATLSFPVSDWVARRSAGRFLESLRDRGYAATPEDYFSSDGDAERDVFQHPAMIVDATKPALGKLRNIEPPIPGLARRPPRCDRYFAKRTEIGALFDPPMADEREAAERMLDAIRSQSERLDQVREAFKRPEAVWTVKWQNPYLTAPGGAALPNIVESHFQLRKYADLAASEALLHLGTREAAAAAENIGTLFDLQRLFLESKASVLSSLLFPVVLDQSAELIWEGALRSIWNDTQLAGFEERLRDFDPQRLAVEGFKGEAALLPAYINAAINLRRERQDLFVTTGWKPDKESIGARLRGIWRAARPHGFDVLNAVEAQRRIIEEGPLASGRLRQRFEPEDMLRFRQLEESSPLVIYADKAGTTFKSRDPDAEGWSTLKSAATVSLRAEAGIAVLRTGIALERHHLKHGSYPTALQDLVPDFLPALPTDPFDRKSLRYQRMPDGSPRVWSIDADLLDEGGLPHRDRGSKGDLVWITRPIPGFTAQDAIRR